MQFIIRAVISLLLITPASAQQMGTPSQIALQVDNAVGVLAQRAEYAEQQVEALQKELAALKAKCGDVCAEKK